jgi:mycothiol synthase
MDRVNFMMIDTYSYSGEKDLIAMQAALAVWIQLAGSCGYCHVGDLPHRIYNSQRGRYPLDQIIRIWHEAGVIAAFTLASPRHDVFNTFVSPALRGSDVEREALVWGYTTTRDWMDRLDKHDKPVITDVEEGDDPRHELLTELGYLPNETPYLFINERSLETPLPETVLPEGYTIRAVLGEEDAEQLAAVHSSAFGSNWTGEEYRDQVMRKPGYHPELERVVIAPNGEFAAFCLIWLDSVNRIGLFEPVGTHERYQRMGLGKALLAHGLQLIRQRGMQTADVCSETDNPASNSLYKAVGFSPRHTVTEFKRSPS